MHAFKAAMTIAMVLTAAFASPAPAQWAEEPGGRELSRQMRLGIRFYEKGDDMKAMDRFMDVLTSGDPSERAMANEYINLLTHRMNTGERRELPKRGPAPLEAAPPPKAPASEAPPPPAPAAVEAVAPAEEAAAPPRPAAPVRPRQPEASEPASGPPPPVADKEAVKQEIKAKLRGALEAGLEEVRAIAGARVLARSNGDPEAIAIPAAALFSAGIAFRKEAVAILEALTRVVYNAGSAQVMILPEGTSVGDAKILDMRRTMGISAHFFSAGIAPARVRVNLLNTQVDIPKSLQDFRGVVLLFDYDRPLALSAEGAVGEEGGPAISLGVFPASLRPERGEGTVIEFSVQEPAAGLASWRFQLLAPAQADGRDLAPLQEVVGSAPVFHRIYWNGRQNYFGPALSPGRYECVLTAVDAKNRRRTLHRWISLPEPPGSPGAAARARSTGAPASELPGAKAAPAGSLIKAQVVAESFKAPAAAGGAAIKDKKRPAARRRPGRKAAGKPAPAAAAEAPKAAMPERPSEYQLEFNKDTRQLTPESERRLTQVADAVAYFPLETLEVSGYAQSGEPQAPELAEKRAQLVAGLLINRFQVEPKKIRLTSTVTQEPAYKVSVRFARSP